tara:strand:- start:174 stop:311 length:138 start_codon:yes stop_codon:yes gene_type:complete
VKHEIISFDFGLGLLNILEIKYDLTNLINIKISIGIIKGIILNIT